MEINKEKLEEFKKVLGKFKLISNKERHEEHKLDKPISSLKKTITKNTLPKRLTKKEIYRSCTRKVKYNSISSAKRMMSKVKEERGTELRCYFCDICGCYHLTKRV